MTALLMVGKLKDCATYPVDDLTPEHLDILDASPLTSIPENQEEMLRFLYRRLTPGNAYFWGQMRESLIGIGRQDLADVVGRKLKEFDTHQGRPPTKGWRGAAKRLDQNLLNGSLRGVYRRLAQH